MRTMEIEVGGVVARWAGGTFVAVWRPERRNEHVPDAMVTVPQSVNRTRATAEDIARIVERAVSR